MTFRQRLGLFLLCLIAVIVGPKAFERMAEWEERNHSGI